MADMIERIFKRIIEIVGEATSSTLTDNDYAVVDSGDNGTRKTKLSALATWIHNKWASFVHACTAITSFANGDTFSVSNPTDGTRKMSKDTLLTLTSQNALAGNVVQSFDPTRDEYHKYLAGESVTYEGKTYTFKVDHYGAWNAADVYAEPVIDIAKRQASCRNSDADRRS